MNDLGDESQKSEHLSPGERLDSWKEISLYLKRTVRTVQRWEQTEELPVHRIVHDKRSSVFAFRAELDAWWRSRQATKSGRLVAPEIPTRTSASPVSRRPDFYWIILVALAVTVGAMLVLRT